MKTLDLRLDPEGTVTGGKCGKTKPAYGVANQPFPALVAKWAKVENARLGLRFMNLLAHGTVGGKPVTIRS
jgi:hypothetical protein